MADRPDYLEEAWEVLHGGAPDSATVFALMGIGYELRAVADELRNIRMRGING